MNKRYASLTVGILVVFGFVFFAPIQNASSPGSVCVAPYPCVIHYQRSLSCGLLGIGDMYWQGQAYFGCMPIVP